MEDWSAKIFLTFILVILPSLLNAQVSCAGQEVKYIDFGGSHFLRPGPNISPRISLSLNPSAYKDDLYGKNKGGFFSQNVNIKTRNIRSSKPGDLLTSQELTLESGFTLLESLNIIGKFENEKPKSEDPEIKKYSVLIGPFIKIEDFKIRAAYRRIVPDLLNASQGFFFDLDYRPWRYISLSTSAYKQWTNASPTTHGLFNLQSVPLASHQLLRGWNSATQIRGERTIVTELLIHILQDSITNGRDTWLLLTINSKSWMNRKAHTEIPIQIQWQQRLKKSGPILRLGLRED